MSKKQNLIKPSNKEPVKDLLTDISEMSLDEILSTMSNQQELLENIPIIKWLFIGDKIRSNIMSAHFIKKYAYFIGQITKNLEDIDNDLLSEIDDEKTSQQIVDYTIIYLDRYHNEFKAKLLGELFIQTFKKFHFSSKEYNSLMFSIEQIHPVDGIDKLEEFYDYAKRMEGEINEDKKRSIWQEGAKLEYQSLATTGLLILPVGDSGIGNYGGAKLSDIGKRFYELVVLNCN
ncbi:hypothetical protein [Sulfurimonas sp.]|uniref:hypothetical protein n=1 Tax=Sulfurimonas sp. TaxID=2022749 RepID=UPI0025FB66D5|nr:hypothetical protein [Sulfurimonas sp.]